MAFKFFRKKDVPVTTKTQIEEESMFTAEELDKVDAGYQKTQDDYNKIFAESDYINEKQRNELNEMLSEEKPELKENNYSK